MKMNCETRFLKRKERASIFVLTVSAKDQRIKSLVLEPREKQETMEALWGRRSGLLVHINMGFDPFFPKGQVPFLIFTTMPLMTFLSFSTKF